MLRVLFGLLVCFASFVAPAAQAGILGINGPTQLEDDDWESQVKDGGTLGKLDVGDILLAVVVIQKSSPVLGVQNLALDGSLTSGANTSYSSSTKTITGISIIRVASVVSTLLGFGAEFSFVGATAAEWLLYSGLVVTDGVAAILYEDPISFPAEHITFTSVALGIATATNGSMIAEFTPVAWKANSVDLTGDPTDPLKIDVLDFVAGLNTSNPIFAPHNILADPDFAPTLDVQAFFAGIGPTDLQIQGSLGTGAKGGFQLATDSDLYVNIVPEPASFAIFGLMTLGGIAYRRRQSK